MRARSVLQTTPAELLCSDASRAQTSIAAASQRKARRAAKRARGDEAVRQQIAVVEAVTAAVLADEGRLPDRTALARGQLRGPHVVRLEPAEASTEVAAIGDGNALTGLTFVLTGSFKETTAALQDCVEAHSGTVQKTVSSNTDFLLFGDEICAAKFDVVRLGRGSWGACTALHFARAAQHWLRASWPGAKSRGLTVSACRLGSTRSP